MTEGDLPQHHGITIFTIGFAQRSAREFFDALRQAGVRKVVDIRLNNTSQLSGFTKRDDLAYFLQTIAGIGYEHRPELAPTKELLDDYKKKRLNWAEYEDRFLNIMVERRIENLMTPTDLDHACLLCSEPKPDKCHRRLVAEYFRSKWSDTQIFHL